MIRFSPFSILLLFSFPASSFEVAGTKGRLETEFKSAYVYNGHNPSLKKIGRNLQSWLEDFIKGKLKFPLLVKKPYFLNPAFQSFVFKDIYFDTNNGELAKGNAAYRLRYRWTGLDKYHRYKIFPWISPLYPDRCEVQFKWGYQFEEKLSIVSVQESRFEFRNQSEPFIRNQDAPSSPWPQKEFEKYAKEGVYRNWELLPFHNLKEHFGMDISIKPLVEVETIRYRTHLNIVQPWGSGPNPEQAFIITIDVAFPLDRKGKPFLEFEIERERNTSDKLEEWAAKEKGKRVDIDAIVEFSQKALEALKSDHMKLSQYLNDKLKEELKLKQLTPSGKYHRIFNQLSNGEGH